MDQIILFRLERAYVDDHVDFGGAVDDGLLGLEHFGGSGVRAKGKTDDRGDLNATAFEQVGTLFDKGGVDADSGKMIFASFLAQFFDSLAASA